MAERRVALWKRILAYVAFTKVALLVSLQLTFPVEALRDRLRVEAERAGYFVRIGSLGAGLLSLRARSIELSRLASPSVDAVPEALRIDRLSVSPSLFPPGLEVWAHLLDGEAVLRVPLTALSRVSVHAEKIDLGKGNLKGFTGVELNGTGELHVELRGLKPAPAGSASPVDVSQLSGDVTLTVRDATVLGGSMSVRIPQFGPEPTPVDLPKVSFGDVSLRARFEKGMGTFEEAKIKGSDLELTATGSLRLAQRLQYSEPALEVRLKADPEFQKRLGLLGSALSIIPADPKDPSWRMGRLTGRLDNPSFR